MKSATPSGASGQTQNAYNASGQITLQTDPAGEVTSYAYAGANSSIAGGTTTVTAYPDGTGSGEPQDVTLDTYSSNTLVAQTTGYGTPSAQSTVISRDPVSLLPTAITDGDGNVTTYTYQTYSGPGGTPVSSGNVLTKTDGAGDTTAHAYNADNEVWCTVVPAEYANGVRCPTSEPTAPPAPGATDPYLGATITYFNGVGLPTATTDPLGHTATFSYTAGISGVPNNLVYCALDAVDYAAGHTCGPYASHAAGTSTSTYDGAGDKVSSTNADGATTTDAYSDAITNPGLVSSSTDPNGTVTTYTYNGAGQTTETTTSFNTGTKTYSSSTLSGYDAHGRPFCSVSAIEAAIGKTCPVSPPAQGTSLPAGITWTFYDADGNVVQVTNALGGTTLSAYDGMGLLYCTVTAQNVAAGTMCPSAEPTTPPGVGNADAYAGATITTYDAAAHAIQVTNAKGGAEIKTYDAAGNLKTTTTESDNPAADPNVVTTFAYDAANRVIQKVVGSGGSEPETTIFAYDPDGHAYCIVSPNAYVSTVSAYQCPAWNPVWIVAPPSPSSLYSSNPSPAQANAVTTDFYDANGKLLQSTNPDIDTSISAYDAAGQPYCTSDPTNVGAYLSVHPSVPYPYNCPASAPSTPPPTASNPGYATTIYDPMGRTLSSTNADGDTTSYTYDGAGNVLTTTDPNGSVSTSCYFNTGSTGCAKSEPQAGGTSDEIFSTTTAPTTADPSGEVSTFTYGPGGTVLNVSTPAATATDAYNAASELTSTSYSGVNATYGATPATLGYTYNPDGSLEVMGDGTGTTTFTYNQLGETASQTFAPSGGSGLAAAATSYQYYAGGALETLSYPTYAGSSNPAVTYTYDADGQMATSVDWLGNRVTFAHDQDNNASGQSNDVASLSQGGTSTLSARYDSADLLENVTTTAANGCGLTQSFTGTSPYNADEQVTADSSTFSGCTGHSNVATNYTYDSTGQVMSQVNTPPGSTSALTFGYDPAGNPTTLSTLSSSALDTDAQTFDAAGEVTTSTPSLAQGGITTAYSYDTLGDQTASSGAAPLAARYNAAAQMVSAATPAAQTSYLYNGEGLEAAATTKVPQSSAWGAPAEIDATTRTLEATDCVSSSFCVAVGTSGYATIYNGTSWSAPADVDGTRTLDAVSCVSSTFCVAVDTSGYATIYNGTSWSSPANVDSSHALDSVSCVSTTFCAAVGASGSAVTYGAKGWSARSDVDASRTLDSVSCASANFCAAVGTGGYGVLYTGTWGAATDVDATRNLNAVSCGAQGFCAAVGASGYATTYAGGKWQAIASDIDGTRTLNAVSCTVSAFCVAAGTSGYIVTYANKAWASPQDVDAARSLDAAECVSSSTFCVVGGASGYAATYNGTWAPATDIDASRTIDALGCASASYCAAVGTSGYGVLWAPTASTSTTAQLIWDTSGSLPGTASSSGPPLPDVLSDGTFDYLYGPSGTPIEQIKLATSTPTYLAYNATASTWSSFDESGDLTGFWGYDAYGSVAYGTPTSAFGFAGQYVDPTTSFSDLRARFYNPASGGFTSRDPAFLQADSAYSYAGSDPVNSGDPSGLCNSPGGTFLVPGPCHFSSRSWGDWAQNWIRSQNSGGGFSFTNGLRSVADFGAGVANAVVSTVTLGNVHISAPYCTNVSWAYGLGNVFGYALTLVGGGEVLDALRGGEAVTALATGQDEAVFWSGIQGGDSSAASWAAKNGGTTLENALSRDGIELPTFDPTNPDSVSAWRQASADFANGARGNVVVLQNSAVRADSVWAEVEFPALTSNPNVASITAVNPETGVRTVLWSRP